MYAVIRTGGKQYKVAQNDVLRVEKLAGDPGSKVTFSEVLALGDEKGVTLGAPLVKGASVAAEVLEQEKSDTIIVFRKKRRQNFRRKQGHRQEQTLLRVTDISAGGKAKKSAKAEDKLEAAAEESKTAETPTE
jgi:large subunit ribosomal protein L21